MKVLRWLMATAKILPFAKPKESLAPHYKMQAKGSKGVIYLYGVIGETWFGDGITAKKFSDDLKDLGNITSLEVRINSEGGNVFEGRAIYSLLTQHAAKKTVYVDGLAASAASLIAMAGDEILMGDGTFMMIHNAWGFAMGNADEMRRTADLLDSVSDTLVDAYAKRTGKPKEYIKQQMDDETWMNAQEAVGEGFADKVVETTRAAACVQFFTQSYEKLPVALHPNHIAAQQAAKLIAANTGSDKLKIFR